MRKILYVTLLAALLLHSPLIAQPVQPAKPAAAPAPVAAASSAKELNPIVLSNQMMITFMERFKNGNFQEARKIADDMIFGFEKLTDTPEKVSRTFSTLMGKKLYERQLKSEGSAAKVDWVEQPIADGFYFHALLDFQDKKVAAALENLQKAIFWDPVRAAFYIERGFMMMHQETSPELAMVLATYLKALELAESRQDFAAAMRGIGFVFVEKLDLAAGLASYLIAKKMDPEDKTALREIEYIRAQAPGLVRMMDDAKAAALLAERKIPSIIDPAHVQVLQEIAAELEKKQSIKELKAVLRQILELDPENAQAQGKLAGMPR